MTRLAAYDYRAGSTLRVGPDLDTAMYVHLQVFPKGPLVDQLHVIPSVFARRFNDQRIAVPLGLALQI
jgi:hypothetical protein